MVTIQDYLADTEYTANGLLSLIWADHKKIEELQLKIKALDAEVQREYNSSLLMQMQAEDPDDVMAGVGRYWENYFGKDKELFHSNEQLNKYTSLITVHELSIQQLSGSLLEHAKRGLSVIYGAPRLWPSGRMIGSQPISKIILEGRNQSAHVDEAIRNGRFGKADVAVCFNTLAAEIDPVFGDFLRRDMSFDLVRTFGWTEYAKYHADIASIQ